MKDERKLCDLMPMSWATVKRMDTPGEMRRRFLDIGLIEGTDVLCLGKSPAGDPSAYLIRGAVIAIRHRDAATIVISDVAEGGLSWD